MSWRSLLAHVLWRLDPERTHHLGLLVLRALQAVPGLAALLRRRLGPHDAVLRVRAWDLELPGPVGLAAGFDKDAVAVDALAALGFGAVEVGTVTARAQPGNPRPRLARLPADRALVNRLGFNNDGAAAAAARLERGRRRRARVDVVVGVNLGRTKAVADAEAPADYAAGARLVAPHADYVVVNVSSPNTPGLRDLQAVAALRPLLVAVRAALDEAGGGRHVPLLVKIAPDLGDDDVDAVADLALELGLDGIVATNTTVGRPGLSSDRAAVEAAGPGGLSGPPLAPRALDVLRRLRARTAGRLVLVAVGGIETPQDAWTRLRAGATFVQAYTGFVHGGPGWPAAMHAGLAALSRRDGFATVQDAIGADA